MISHNLTGNKSIYMGSEKVTIPIILNFRQFYVSLLWHVDDDNNNIISNNSD